MEEKKLIRKQIFKLRKECTDSQVEAWSRQIAQKVAELVEEGECIMLDSSSTSLMIAQSLKKKEKLTVITNSVEVLIELSGCEGIQVISTGGTLRDSSLSLVGKAASDILSRYNVDKAILSCKGLDISKLDSVYFIKVMDLEPGDILVTNQLPNKEWRDYLERKQVRFIEG